jgi:hypothetical protein
MIPFPVILTYTAQLVYCQAIYGGEYSTWYGGGKIPKKVCILRYAKTFPVRQKSSEKHKKILYFIVFLFVINQIGSGE